MFRRTSGGAKMQADTLLALVVLGLIALGALVFTSAALGLIARGESHISSVIFNHFALGLGGGLLLAVVAYMIETRHWRRFAPYIFGATLLATALVFIPTLGMQHGGGLRWIDLGFLTVPPSEFLKMGTIIFAAFYFARLRDETASWVGIAAFTAILAAPALLLLLQPDLGTLGIICISVFSIYIAAGARVRDIALICITGLLILGGLSLTPRYNYVYERLDTFLHPEAQNALGDGYQIQQSFIAIGSGGLVGRGFGQGVQKFTYLPEPMGDSIYAVLAEEFGFLGGSILIGLFLVLALRGYGIAAESTDFFNGLLAVGISTYLAGEAFINIAAMLGLAPLTGVPLTFISQGGSAMLAALASAGILLAASRRRASGRA
jgi:cell division protein FtsW